MRHGLRALLMAVKAWKRTAEMLLARSGPAFLKGRYEYPGVVILAYHNIVPEGEALAGDTSLHLSQQAFSQQLDFLSGRYDIVTLASAFQEPAPTRDLRVVITFDDAYRGALTAGAEELEKRGLPATIFVPTALLGCNGFWWDRLAQPDMPLDPQIRETALQDLEGSPEKIQRWADRRRLPQQDLPSHSLPLSAPELLDHRLHHGITFGAHTCSHANLAALRPREAEAEMLCSKEWLASRTDRFVNWIAYPYGSFSPTVSSIAAEMFDGGLLVSGGMATRRGRRRNPPQETPRVNVPRGLTLDGLKLRISGLLA